MSLLDKALECGADVFLTADIKYHEAQDALNAGLALIDGGHFYTENLIMKRLEALVAKDLGHLNIQSKVSEVNTDPFRFYQR